MTKLFYLFPLALATMPALAAEPLSLETRVVVTADLDLTSEAGKAMLDRRLDRAAADVCGAAADVDLEGRNAVRACRTDVIAAVRATRDARIATASVQPIEIALR